MALTDGERMQLENLCKIFNIRVQAAAQNPEAGLVVLQNLYSMPTIDDKPKRRTYGNSVLQASGAVFLTTGRFSSEFHGGVSQHVISMQEFPSWYRALNASPQELADTYEVCKAVAFWLGLFGVGAGVVGAGPAIVEGVTEAISKRSIEAALRQAIRRFAGNSALLEAMAARSALFTGPVLVGLIAGATIAYYAAIDRMSEIATIMLHRYQRGDVSDEIYRRISPEIDPSFIKKYW